MADDDNLMVDLFGDLTTLPSGRRGRPAHRWSKSNADRVILGLALGYSDAEIASGLGVSPPTLRKHYFSELKRREMQRARFDLWRLHKLAELSNDGNVSALKELNKITDRRDREAIDRKVREQNDANPKRGKKEEAQKRAEQAAKTSSFLPKYGSRVN